MTGVTNVLIGRHFISLLETTFYIVSSPVNYFVYRLGFFISCQLSVDFALPERGQRTKSDNFYVKQSLRT